MSSSTRSTSKLLPQIFQTDTNKKFLSATLDQLVEPSALVKLSSFIGKRHKPTYRSKDNYVAELTAERQNYQLEPAVSYASDGRNTDFIAPYIDVVNEIDAQGGQKKNHEKLWNEDFYSYAPPIDADKFVNYRQYYWLKDGPSSITTLPGSPGCEITINVTNNKLSAWKFNNKTTDNPDIVVYKGNTYNFVIDSPGFNFYIKTQYGTGTGDQFDDSYVTNNGTDKGTVTLKVPASDSSTTNETVIFYQCEHHQDMQGRLIVKDLDIEKFDPAENIVGVNKFVDSTGLEYTTGMKLRFTNDVTATYSSKKMYCEMVGTGIRLVDINDLNVFESYGVDTGEVFDENGIVGFDTVGFDNSEGVSVNKDYWTIGKSAINRNAWSRANRWFHIDVINKSNEKNPLSPTQTTEALRAKRPIIEFDPDLQLFNHGTKFKKVTFIDTLVTDALSKVQGTTGFRVDQTSLKANDTVVFINDPEQRNKIFTVHFDALPNGTQVIHLDDDSTTVQENTSIVATDGESFKGKTYHYTNGTWKLSQAKTGVQQKPLFDIVNGNGVSLSDSTVFNSTNFTGSTLFEIATSTQGTPDTEYGTNVIYKRFGLLTDLQVNEKFNSEVFNYINSLGNLVKEPVRKYFLKVNSDSSYVLKNNFAKTKISNQQYKIENYESTDQQTKFEIRSWNDVTALTDLDVKVSVNGVKTTKYTLQNQNQSRFVVFTDKQTEGSLISIKTFSPTATSSNFGFWDVPISTTSNPYNKNFTDFTFGDIIQHYVTGIENHPDAVGSSQGENNSRNIDNTFYYGTQIVQHSGSLPLSSVIIRDDVINITKSLRFASKEYEKFKNSIVTVANRIALNGTVAQQLDDIINEINKNKNSTFAFAKTDMLGYGTDKKVLSYTVDDANITNYPITSEFDLDSLSQKSIYVYKNDVQLVHGLDYEFTNLEDSSNIIGIVIKSSLAVDDVLKIHEYESTNNNFVPPTPAKLGLAPSYRPRIFEDDTYQTAIDVIEGHDGSITVAYGDFRDNILLEFEKRIFNNIKTKHNADVFDLKQSYNTQEIENLFARDFYTWTGSNGIDYATNSSYDSANEFTYNYSGDVDTIDGSALKGFWRGIYKQLFGTDRPHTAPWEMFGFSIKPSWWDSRYGPAPYTKGNTILWNDVKEGFIAGGDRKGYHKKYERNYITSVIPVTENGKLNSPINSGITIGTASNSSYQSKWEYGDVAPAEAAWYKSSSYRFAEQIALFLAFPNKYSGIMFDTSRITKSTIGQYIYDNDYRKIISDYVVPNSTSLTTGFINYIVDYVIHLGYDISYVSNRLANLESKLIYKLGGFSNKNNMRAVISSYNPESTNRSVYLPDENLNFLLFKSAPTDYVNYSGVIVEKDSGGYKVSGYNNFDRSFKYYQPRKNNDFVTIVVGGTTPAYYDWKPGGFYSSGSIVKYESSFYRASKNIQSGETFDETNYTVIGRVLPLQGDTRVKKYNKHLQNVSTLPYGTVLANIQEVADFLYGYSKYLESKGFVFDDFSEELQVPVDWDLSVKEFLFWTTQGWQDQAVITLSPASAKIKYIKDFATGDDLVTGSQYYTVLQQDGFPIDKSNLRTSRIDGEFIISTNPNEDGIYNVDIRAIQKEHVVIFDNITSFKDVIFDDTLGVRQDRIKLVGWKTDLWNGDIFAPGYIVDQAKVSVWQTNNDYKKGDVVQHQNLTYVSLSTHNSGEEFNPQKYSLKFSTPERDLLPNFDSKAESFRDFYSLDTDNFDSEQQKYAQHLIGFETRNYFENLGLDELTQYKFYQGMLRDKGTKKPIEKFKSPTQTQTSVNYSFFEEQAFRVGEYGGHRTLDEFEWQLSDKSHRQQRQIYNFTQASQDDTQNIINVGYNDFTKRPIETSYPIFSNYEYSTRYTPEFIFQYPQAGYVQPRHVTASVWDENELLNLNSSNLIEGNTIWMANTSNGDWNIYRVSSINNNIQYYDARDGIMQFTTETPHGLEANDYVVVKGYDNAIDGIYKVTESPDSTDNLYKFSVAFDQTFDSTNQNGTIFKLQSIRINDIDDLDTIRPAHDFINGDKVYVDNNYWRSNGRWKIYSLDDASYFAVNRNYYNATNNIDDTEFASSIDIADQDGKTMVVGSPGDNVVNIYTRNTSSGTFALSRDLSQDYKNSDSSDRFGHSVAISGDGSKIFVGSPYSNNIIKLTLSSTDLSYNRGKLITGSVSGATGRVLFNDAVNDIMWVKVVSGTFTTEPLDIGDSSSVVTITSVEGTDLENQGAVHYIGKDSIGSYLIDHTQTSPNAQNNEYFGWSIDTTQTGDFLVVGAPGKTQVNSDSTSNVGRVYIYKLNANGTYIHNQTLTGSDSQEGDSFGFSVSISQNGDTLVVGSPTYGRTDTNDSSTELSGRAYVYRKSENGTFTVNEILEHGVDEYNSQFGYKVQVSNDGNDLLIGSPNETNVLTNQGLIYYYKLSTQTFAGDGSTTSFTTNFNIDTNHTIGVTQNGNVTTSWSNVGNVITFAVAPSDGDVVTVDQYKQYQAIAQFVPVINSGFGSNFRLRGNRLVVYAPNDDTDLQTTFDRLGEDGSTKIKAVTSFDGGNTNFYDKVSGTGSVYNFNKINTKFIYENKITSNDIGANDRFGYAIDSHNNQLFVGSPYKEVFSTVTDTTLNNAGTLYNFKKTSTESSSWQVLSSQPVLTDPNRISKSFIYDNKTDTLINRLNVLDTAKGKLFGPVEQNISYKTFYDPADYDSWGAEHIGEVWFDLNKFKTVWYEQGDLNYRLLNWNTIHPSSTVEFKEWVESEYLPTDYNALANTNEGVAQNITGTAETSSFVTKQIFDDNKQQFVNRYFYWVTNPTVLPSSTYRTVTCLQMANSIKSPKSFDEKFAGLVREDALLVSLNSDEIGSSTSYKIEQTVENAVQQHSEYSLVPKDDPDAEIPSQILDKMIDSLIGIDALGRSVPDLNVPYAMRYGIGNRPRQTVYKDRTQALKTVIQSINESLATKPFASLKNLEYWNLIDKEPSQEVEGWILSVDTDTDLRYINTETYSTGDKVLVKNDARAENRWTINTFNSNREFDLTKVQSYNTKNYWTYKNYYAPGYDENVVTNYTVENEASMRSTSYVVGDVIKVKSSYDGKFRIYLKTYNDFQSIAIEQGTFELDSAIYDFESNEIGYGGDAYAFNVFDKEATTELRNIFLGLQKDIFIDDDRLLFVDLFFLMVEIANQQIKSNDWTFKSSFIKLIATHSQFDQPPEFKFNTTDSVEDFLNEVLPFKTKIRENVAKYNNLVTFEGDVTDFDNPTYYDKDQKQYVNPQMFNDDSSYFDVYNKYPHKFYSENYKFYVKSIDIGTPGSGYTVAPEVLITGGGGSGAKATAFISNGSISKITVTASGSGYTTTPTVTINGGGGTVTQTAVCSARLNNDKVRTFDNIVKFDRVNSNKQIANATIIEWEPFTKYTVGKNIRYVNKIYRVIEEFTSGRTFEDYIRLADSSSVLPSANDVITEWTATDRIHAYYQPTTGMPGLIGDGSTAVNAYSQLMTGLEYAGTRLLSLKFEEGDGYDVDSYDMTNYDSQESQIVDPEQLLNLDQIVDSKTFTTTLGTKAEDINIVGDAFLSEYSAQAPEEVLPGGVYDTMDMKIYTQPSNGSGIINTTKYQGDGSTTTFAVQGQVINNSSIRVFKNNQYQGSGGAHYSFDHTAKTITFNTAPQSGDIVVVQAFDFGVDSLISEYEFDGDGSTTSFTVPLSRDLVKQTYVSVDGVKTSITVTSVGDSASTRFTFSSAPADNSKIFVYVFNKDTSTKAYAEMTTTEYTVSTTNPIVALTSVPGVLGPHHHKVLVEGTSGTDSTNRYKLSPPQIAYYTGDGTSVDFAIPNSPESRYLASNSNVEVWKNGIVQTVATHYTVINDSSSVASVRFGTTPAEGDTIAVILKEGHDYDISNDGNFLNLRNNWSTVEGSDSSSIHNEKIFVTTFTNQDNTVLRTEVFETEVLTNNSDLEITLSNTPINENYVFVAWNKEYLTSNHQWTLRGNKIIVPYQIANNGQTNKLDVTYISGTQSQPAIGYRIFKDVLNRYHFRRLSKDHTTRLAQALDLSDTTITVSDGSVLPEPSISKNQPGVVFIGKERITYFAKSGNTLSQIMRGTLGTAVTETHASGTKVVDASLNQEIPYSDTLQKAIFTGDGSTTVFNLSTADDSTPITASSTDQLVVQVGGSTELDYTVDGSNNITFTTAPADGVIVRVTKKLGQVWYDQGTNTASNGAGLQGATGVEVEFLQKSQAELPDN